MCTLLKYLNCKYALDPSWLSKLVNRVNMLWFGFVLMSHFIGSIAFDRDHEITQTLFIFYIARIKNNNKPKERVLSAFIDQAERKYEFKS